MHSYAYILYLRHTNINITDIVICIYNTKKRNKRDNY